MNKKTFTTTVAVIVVLAFVVTGCLPTGNSFQKSTTQDFVNGRAVLPKVCFIDGEINPDILDGVAFPLATSLLYGGNSGVLNQQGETDKSGRFVLTKGNENSYVLYVIREYPNLGTNNFVVVKKGINQSILMGDDVGEVNYYTTAQVIIWEQVNDLLVESFNPFDARNLPWSFIANDLVLPVSDIPNLIPTNQLLNLVKVALENCRDPQGDPQVIAEARRIARNDFGSPGGSSSGTVVIPTPFIAPTPNPTPNPTPTPTTTPDTDPTPNPTPNPTPTPTTTPDTDPTPNPTPNPTPSPIPNTGNIHFAIQKNNNNLVVNANWNNGNVPGNEPGTLNNSYTVNLNGNNETFIAYIDNSGNVVVDPVSTITTLQVSVSNNNNKDNLQLWFQDIPGGTYTYNVEVSDNSNDSGNVVGNSP